MTESTAGRPLRRATGLQETCDKWEDSRQVATRCPAPPQANLHNFPPRHLDVLMPPRKRIATYQHPVSRTFATAWTEPIRDVFLSGVEGQNVLFGCFFWLVSPPRFSEVADLASLSESNDDHNTHTAPKAASKAMAMVLITGDPCHL